MIALNELIKDIEKYKELYKLMGLKINLNSFVKLEKQLREAGQAFENSRATCNKKCGELIKKQAQNTNTVTELAEIINLDKQTLKLQAKFNKINKKVNKKLEKLPNLPDDKNLSHLQIETTKTTSSIEDFKAFIEKTFKVNTFSKKTNLFLKGETDKLFEEENLPQITYTKNGIVVFSKKDDVENLFNLFLNYFKTNSLSIVKLSVKELKKSSTQEYLIHLNQDLYFHLELKREFFSRKYKVKYHDKSTDMTKFINQIDIVF